VPPFFANIGKRLVKTPKGYQTDTGLACHLSASDRWETLISQNRVGQMVETWVMTEIRKMIAVSSRPTELLYWRTSTGQEVDFLLERGGEVVGIEVKWGAGIQEKDLSGMVACREALGERWRMGVLLNGGTETVPIDEKTLAVPFGVFFGREM
jgi:predicted AAA+ superfamily ATPase